MIFLDSKASIQPGKRKFEDGRFQKELQLPKRSASFVLLLLLFSFFPLFSFLLDELEKELM